MSVARPGGEAVADAGAPAAATA
ncbi:MAG: hypothetical protein QOI73_1048, partial [Solirubrobacteraceae bacterium]|nr:hypothetical protein [Solirubrobacteraceae bacterium]